MQNAKLKMCIANAIFAFIGFLHYSLLILNFAVERSHSGLVRRSRKPKSLNGDRGFESHPLRHFLKDKGERGKAEERIKAQGEREWRNKKVKKLSLFNVKKLRQLGYGRKT